MPGSEPTEPTSAENAENTENVEDNEGSEKVEDNKNSETVEENESTENVEGIENAANVEEDEGAGIGGAVVQDESAPEAEAEDEAEAQPGPEPEVEHVADQEPDSGAEPEVPGEIADAAPEQELRDSPEETDPQDPREPQQDAQPEQVWAAPDAVVAQDAQVGPTAPPVAPVPPAAPGVPGAPEQPQPDVADYLGIYTDGSYGAAAAVQVDPAVGKRKRKRKRTLWTVAAVVAAAALITGGVVALLPGRTGNSVVAAVACKPASLAGCLIKAPAGAERLTASSAKDVWLRQTAFSSPGPFVSDILDDSPGIGGDAPGELSTDGLHTIVHNDWNAVDGDDVDLALLSFDSQTGAQDWNDTREGEVLAAYPGQTVNIPGDSTGAAHVAAKADSKGDIDAAYSAVVGDIVLDVAYSSPKTFDAQDLENWASTELASLRTALPAPADPAPTLPATQQVGCTGKITSCLMKVPSGGERWNDPTDSRWSGNSTLTSSQVAHLWWDSDSASVQASVLSDFNSDGVTAIGHEAWTLDNADEQADIYLIQADTAVGADELSSVELREPKWNRGSGISYSVPGGLGGQAWYSSKTDENGFTEFFYTVTLGNVDVVEWFYFYGPLDKSLTNNWLNAQVDKVKATVKSEPMGMFSLAAPTLPAPAKGSCAVSTGCLVPLPAGATDTLTQSYEASSRVTDEDYAGQYEASTSVEFATWLGSDGFQGGQHRSFTASNGATADAVLLKFTKPAQAKASAMLEFGINAGADRVCTDAAVPDSWCLAAPVSSTDYLQKEQVWVVAWKGDYEVSVDVTTSNSADLTQAYEWAEQQLDLLPAS